MRKKMRIFGLIIFSIMVVFLAINWGVSNSQEIKRYASNLNDRKITIGERVLRVIKETTRSILKEEWANIKTQILR